MKAALLKSPGELVITQVPDPQLPPKGLVVKVEACSICATDIKMFRHGQRDLIYPRILGHEIAGVVTETSTGDIPFKRGERVQIAPGISCNRCLACQRGAPNQCDHIGIFGFTHHGGFAQYLAVPTQSIACGGVNLIPSGITFVEATFAEPLACCLNGQELVRLDSQDVVLILGAGPMGCLHTMLARAKGVRQILLVERSLKRLTMAIKAKPSRLINVSKENLKEVVKEETEGRGVDVIMLTCPESAIDYPILELLAPRGRVCFFSGLPQEKRQLYFDANFLHYREITFVGAYGCTADQNRLALEFMASGKVNVNWLVTKRISLEALHDGINCLTGHDCLKVVVTEF
ncbi:MAG TPA: alcohol dehydrogenase catalytic domain-containing protein [Dehalococcoidia bacterium]|nr:alcohol dehydrogenase catalytic domain-containing protein [Dehalococcoidia bacterium]